MTRDEIIRMAREAGFVVDEKAQQHQPNCIFHTWHLIDEGLARFAALVAAAERDRCYELIETLVEAEREECAKVCEEHWRFNAPASECADAIRARGNDA